MIVSAIPVVLFICLGFSLDVVGESVESNATSTLPAWCHGYKILDSFYRNLDNPLCVYDDYDCHQDGTYQGSGGESIEKSSDWQGPGYYRFLEPAGTRLATGYPDPKHCGAMFPGWTRDSSHPEEVGEIKNMIVCYDVHENCPGCGCYGQTEISVTNCDGFYVYWLVDMDKFPGKYCGAS